VNDAGRWAEGSPRDAEWFRRVLGQYPTGVTLVTAREEDGDPVAMVVGSFTSVSLDPPLVGFLADHKSTSWPRIRAAGQFCANVLSGEHEDACRAFTAKLPDRFEVHCPANSPSGNPLLTGAAAWIDCELESVTTVGDHDFAVGQVRNLAMADATRPPLLFFSGRVRRPRPGTGGRSQVGAGDSPAARPAHAIRVSGYQRFR
jgi:flavin reductase (DIM6/NTAB) family NADH-FMN oxidoreductase RutF